jgi:hypothetical protein
MPARLANEEYVEALARLVYYWAYPAIDVTSRTSMWELMKEGPGLMFRRHLDDDRFPAQIEERHAVERVRHRPRFARQ